MTDELRVEDVMTRELVTLSPSMSLKQMDEILLEHAVNGAPVLEKDELVGVASRADSGSIPFRRSAARHGEG